MFDSVTATILIALFEFAIVTAVAIPPAVLVVWFFRLQAGIYRRAIARYLKDGRRRHYRERGLDPSRRFLKELLAFEAAKLLSNGHARTSGSLPRWTLNLGLRLNASFENPEVMADTVDSQDNFARKTMKAQLLALVPGIERRFERALLAVCCASGVLLCSLTPYNVLDSLSSGGWTLSIDGPLTTDWREWFGRLVTGFGCGALVFALLLRRMEPRAGADVVPARPQAPPPRAATDKYRIGTPGQPIRAINFSAGGLDSVMQLGVIHALTVIQGKAPDAVLGLSVGAVNAVGLAEVIHAGEDAERAAIEKKEKEPGALFTDDELRDVQAARLVARAERLRELIEAAQRAPERLFDALLPDAYQIDDTRPLAPLRQPRFSHSERQKRGEFVAARSGLARLYNHLLDIPISFGTLAKATRRVLGIVAAGELSTGRARLAIWATEGMRLWVLLGQNLIPVAKLIPVLLRTYFGGEKSPDTASAGLLIFRNRFWSNSRHVGLYVIGGIFLFASWYAISLFALPIALLFALFMWAFYSQIDNPSILLRTAAIDFRQGLLGWLTLTIAFTALWWSLLNIYVLLVPEKLPVTAPAIWDLLTDFWLIPLAYTIFAILFIVFVVIATRANPKHFGVRMLAPYGLSQSLFRDHGLRTYFADLFDRSFFEKPPVDAAVCAALSHKETSDARSAAGPPKTVSHYSASKRLEGERILVGLAVADTERGGLDVVPEETPLVDGLAAATALTPYLPPVELETNVRDAADAPGVRRKVLYVDGSKVSREPTQALLQLVRDHRNPDHGPLHIYSVTPFPSSKLEMPEVDSDGTRKDSRFLNLLDIARRALRLQRFRDASLERRLTELVTFAIPPDKNHCEGHDGRQLLRSWIAPIELEHDANLNWRILSAEKDDRRRLIEETIADGCRAAMTVMIPDSLPGTGTIKCSKAVTDHFAGQAIRPTLTNLRLCSGKAGASATHDGPGLPEICRACKVHVPEKKKQKPGVEQKMVVERQTLVAGDWKETGPKWPHEREGFKTEESVKRAESAKAKETAETDRKIDPMKRFKRKPLPEHAQIEEAWEAYREAYRKRAKTCWPREMIEPEKELDPETARPTVSLLFSGGVFRGVFQVGVLAGLNEVGIRPDVVAGASVGSIAAAMIARTFSHAENDPTARATSIARIAGAFLSVDRFILTDRFADFVRLLTMRAAEMRFSIRDADRVFRKYDYPSFPQLERSLRHVVAGIERLLYLDPYELNDLVRAIRAGDNEQMIGRVRDHVQKFLDRMQIGEEALGAEALEELIGRYVTYRTGAGSHAPFTIDTLREEHGVQFLATTTNLQSGRLEVLGEWPEVDGHPSPKISQVLLASSAFPGIFRPRWAWELSLHDDATERFVDGGVMDNLPVDAIARFLYRAAKLKMIAPRPVTAPHLIIGASLEVNAPAYSLAYTRERFKSSWLALSKRASQLRYNTKLQTYSFAQQAIRHLMKDVGNSKSSQAGDRGSLLGIELVAIKPNWLCDTFAIHPMLGFKRKRHIRSIAHGCASTLLELARVRKEQVDLQKRAAAAAQKEFEEAPTWLAHWRISEDHLPEYKNWDVLFEELQEREEKRKKEEKKNKTPKDSPEAIAKASKCWLRPTCDCPFSRLKLASLRPALEQELIDEVSRVHELCADAKTHLRPV